MKNVDAVIYQKAEKDKLKRYNVSESSMSSIVEIAGMIGDDTALRLRTELLSDEGFFFKLPKWHRTCQSSWLRKRNPSISNSEEPPLNTFNQDESHSAAAPIATLAENHFMCNM